MPRVRTEMPIVNKRTAAMCRERANIKALERIDRILDEEARIALSDIRQLFDPDDWTLLPPSKLPDSIAAAIASVEVIEKIIPRKDQEPIVIVAYKYRLWDKGASLDRLHRHHGLYQKDNAQKPSPVFNQYNQFNHLDLGGLSTEELQGLVGEGIRRNSVKLLPGPDYNTDEE